MKQTRFLMGMPITVEIVDAGVSAESFDPIYAYFRHVDETFSPFKATSEVSRLNRGELDWENISEEMETILTLADITRQQTHGYFDVFYQGKFDPCGVVKGWAIYQAAELLRTAGYHDFYVDAGGDIQCYGHNLRGQKWQIGIRNPFDQTQIVKSVGLDNHGIATSGLYERGKHLYNPHQVDDPLDQIVSITVIGPNVFEADRFATAAFVMGEEGILFIEALTGFEAYAIDRDGIATMTSGFIHYANV